MCVVVYEPDLHGRAYPLVDSESEHSLQKMNESYTSTFCLEKEYENCRAAWP